MIKLFRKYFRTIKFFFQRLFFGFSEEDTWSLDVHLGKLILPRLKLYKKLSICHPTDMEWEEWQKILDKMIYAFEFYATESPWRLDIKEEDFLKAEEGLQLFGKYFPQLWW